MKRLSYLIISTITILFLVAGIAESSGICNAPAVVGVEPIEHLCDLLSGAKISDLSFCLGHIKKSKHNNDEIADFILTWSPDVYHREIPSVFRSKIDRVIRLLRTVDYQQLIIDIDFIKNSQLTITQMVRIIKGTRLGEKR